MEYRNEFEEKIQNVKFTPDWFKERCAKVKIFESYLDWQNRNFNIYEEAFSNNSKARVVVANIINEVYLCLEWMENDKIEHSQIERVVNAYLGKVIYSNIANAPSATALVFNRIKEGNLKPIVIKEKHHE